jgi:hypothetical protein
MAKKARSSPPPMDEVRPDKHRRKRADRKGKRAMQAQEDESAPSRAAGSPSGDEAAAGMPVEPRPGEPASAAGDPMSGVQRAVPTAAPPRKPPGLAAPRVLLDGTDPGGIEQVRAYPVLDHQHVAGEVFRPHRMSQCHFRRQLAAAHRLRCHASTEIN